MKFYVGVTDNDWFAFLTDRKVDEVNFWRPGGGHPFGVIQPGAPFLFKLHSPLNYIVGGGFFVKYTRLPLSMAWKIFGEKNGAGSFSAFSSQILQYRNDKSNVVHDPEIGCIILASTFFFDKADWIEPPSDWSRHIVQGKSYDTGDPVGKSVWDRVQEKLLKYISVEPAGTESGNVAEPTPLYGAEYLTRGRLGQSAFKALVLDAYGRRCAMTGERTMPVLEAAHIKPFAESGPNTPQNGLLLRADLHILFDRGYITVTHQLNVDVSKRIKEEFENGRDYYALHGTPLKVIPHDGYEKPSKVFLDWHNQNVYRA
jgi:putative restriction endonuclease